MSLGGAITERQVAAFRAVMLAGSVSGAARQLHLSQPAVSTVIRRLEDVLGARLFDRVANRLVPTMEAQRIFEEVQRVYGQFDRLATVMRAIARGERALLRLGSTPSVGRRLVPRALARMMAQRPDLRCYCDQVGVARMVDYLALGQGECVVTLAALDDPVIETRQVAAGRLVCALPEGHRLAGMAALPLAALSDERLISWESGTVHGDMLDRAFRSAQVARQVRAYVWSSETALGLVREGAGIAVLDSFSATGAEREGLVVRPLAESEPVPLYLHWCRLRPHSALVPELGEWLSALSAMPG
ncbi:LysR substrate-binding domain-containing protein [Roseomonas sp. OT10]|uniref:LysR family transcriptional regulator n=1 Tax=Roseomonas cutis TaxID=2897332 RepID=UPI001E510259|nr:LysR substrate-binding domain-containing protein [Roseomonas sp. OT10]UFN47248.1 LysR substrate-binding domain-containing protein [Roseomonas sp. OT10]